MTDIIIYSDISSKAKTDKIEMNGNEDNSQVPYLISNTGNNDNADNTYQYQGPDFNYNNYQNSYGMEQFNIAFGNLFGGFGPNYGFNQFFPLPYPGFYGFPPFQPPPGPPQGPEEPQSPPDPSIVDVVEQGFSENGSPVKKKQNDDENIKALIRCGVPKENLKNLPRNLIKQYYPEYCGLCSLTFDTMTMSRLHYVCKNHLKNQKKWLSQQTEPGYRRTKEQPLRARELYCEICDVHITSKVHSDSHYAGKPHRAIVEGRKNPKNPFLMQRGMEDRLEQLIRRERKHLRTGEEEPTEKEAKAIQPELCCEICDTSVTCSEQMIMHLNGKRHLAKEKYFILNMMKSDGFAASTKNNKKESYEFKNRPDSCDQVRGKQASTSG